MLQRSSHALHSPPWVPMTHHRVPHGRASVLQHDHDSLQEHRDYEICSPSGLGCDVGARRCCVAASSTAFSTKKTIIPRISGALPRPSVKSSSRLVCQSWDDFIACWTDYVDLFRALNLRPKTWLQEARCSLHSSNVLAPLFRLLCWISHLLLIPAHRINERLLEHDLRFQRRGSSGNIRITVLS